MRRTHKLIEKGSGARGNGHAVRLPGRNLKDRDRSKHYRKKAKAFPRCRFGASVIQFMKNKWAKKESFFLIKREREDRARERSNGMRTDAARRKGLTSGVVVRRGRLWNTFNGAFSRSGKRK